MLGISCSQIKNRVRRLVGKYRTTDPYELCECMGIILSDENFGESETAIKAMTMTIARTTIIQLNSSLDEVVHKFITAHELGHAVLHKNMRHIDNGFFDDLSRTEREANLFAAELIFGDSRKLFEYMQYSEQTLFQLAAEKQVPYELLAYKLEIMKEEGFDVPALPYRPDSRFLGRNLQQGEFTAH